MPSTHQPSGAGLWTYRSYSNNPDSNTPCKELELGQADLHIEISKDKEITGRIDGEGWGLELSGIQKDGDPITLFIRGSGKVGGHQWIYDYLCYAIPEMKDGVNQVRALVGAVTRIIPHPNIDGSSPSHPAGVVGSFFAVFRSK
jgi:hypothetical protein